MESCDRCRKKLDKKQVNKFDSTFRGSRKGGKGEKLKLCRDCLFDKFSEYLSSYDFRAVFVYPMKYGQPFHVNAYQFYNFDEMKKYKWPKDYIQGIQNILPSPSTFCQSCTNKTAHFSWCSPDLYGNNYTSTKLSQEGSYQREYLCSSCLFDRFKQKVLENDNVFQEFFPPVDSDGFATSFET